MVDVLSLRVLLAALVGWLDQRQQKALAYFNRVISFGERHLRRTIAEFVAHYHGERNHQGLGNEVIEGAPAVENKVGRIRRRQRLGGLLNYYCRAA